MTECVANVPIIILDFYILKVHIDFIAGKKCVNITIRRGSLSVTVVLGI